MRYCTFPSVASKIMRCPKCGGEMEEGFVFAGGAQAIGWSSKKPGLVSVGDSLVGPLWKRRFIPGHRCESCKLVVMNYNQEDADAPWSD